MGYILIINCSITINSMLMTIISDSYYLQVNIVGDDVGVAECHTTGDPHIDTFDGVYVKMPHYKHSLKIILLIHSLCDTLW